MYLLRKFLFLYYYFLNSSLDPTQIKINKTSSFWSPFGVFVWREGVDLDYHTGSFDTPTFSVKVIRKVIKYQSLHLACILNNLLLHKKLVGCSIKRVACFPTCQQNSEKYFAIWTTLAYNVYIVT